MKQRIAIISGARTPIGRPFGQYKKHSAVDLGAFVVRESIERSGLKDSEIEEVIMGNAAQPLDAANIARVVTLRAGLPANTNAYTVQRGCASGMASITSAAEKIQTGVASIVVAGGTESASNVPLIFDPSMTDWLHSFRNKKNEFLKKIQTLLNFRFHFLKPILGIQQSLTDPVTGLNMGQTAEVIVKEFKISRKEQDLFALKSHEKAIRAIDKGILTDEIVPFPSNNNKGNWPYEDESPVKDLDIQKLEKLKPFFDKRTGTVTLGNSCPLNDGAAAVVLMSESEAKRRKIKPLGYLKDYAYASLEPNRMGLGPVYATSKLLEKNVQLKIKSFDLIEINEAFAGQVIANLKAFESKEFAKKYLGRKTEIGKIDKKILNVNGGSIALGHPIGMTGTRLALHLLYAMQREKKQNSLATLCVGGGQGAALHLQRN